MDNFLEINLNMKGCTWKLRADMKMEIFVVVVVVIR